MRNVFEHPELVNWRGVGLVVAASLIIWSGLVILPESLHHTGIVILGSLSAAVTFLMNSTKAGPQRPEDKKEQP